MLINESLIKRKTNNITIHKWESVFWESVFCMPFGSYCILKILLCWTVLHMQSEHSQLPNFMINMVLFVEDVYHI